MNANNNWLQRGTLLLGDERQKRLCNAHVLIVGLGGVGSWAAEMLCRAGVGSFTLVDADVVDVTNINRQMPALVTTVGRAKCDVVAERLQSINGDVSVTVERIFVDEVNIPQLMFGQPYDFVVDAIDSLPSKAALITYCWQHDVRIISSMGAGAKCDISQIRIGDLWHTEHCTLAKNLRRMLRNTSAWASLPVVFSIEPPIKSAIVPNPSGGKPLIGSIGYFTAVFGCCLAEYVIKNI